MTRLILALRPKPRKGIGSGPVYRDTSSGQKKLTCLALIAWATNGPTTKKLKLVAPLAEKRLGRVSGMRSSGRQSLNGKPGAVSK